MAIGIHFINGQWIEGGAEELLSTDPATGACLWQGRTAGPEQVNGAVRAARDAFESWAESSLSGRTNFLSAFEKQLVAHKEELAQTLSQEIGKPLWESRTELQAMINKVAVTIEAHDRHTATQYRDLNGMKGVTRFKPHGVIAILGPFNLPGHLPNGHIIPALLAGNTVVFKPSEEAPLISQKIMELWQKVDLPAGVLNMIQGDSKTGVELSNHPDINGLFFTGSFNVGRQLSRTFADYPGKILALEMGGNNPLVVHEISDPDAAAYLIIQSAYLTSGQRCTCARRLILPEGNEGDHILKRLADWIHRIQVGPWTQRPEPFMGPVISEQAAARLLEAQLKLQEAGGEPIIEMTSLNARTNMLSPGLMEVTRVQEREDQELFGPLLQIIRVKDFDAAIRQANNTIFGLSVGLISDSKALYDRFYRQVRAGIINWNRQITGASAYLPFGGIGNSGNHRPSGFFAVDYCSYAIGSIEQTQIALPEKLIPGIAP